MTSIRVFLVLAVVAVWAALSAAVSAATVWAGLTESFVKPGFADYTQPEFQDRITSHVTLTRKTMQSIFNIAQESGATQSLSPIDTTWATGVTNPAQTISASNWAALTFTDFMDAYGGQGAVKDNAPIYNAVVHLVTDDIYLDLKFSVWGDGLSGGGFAYERSVAPGDYNGNDVVDAADYTLWQDTVGQTSTIAGSGADGDRSSVVDAGDFTVWKNKFGNLVPGSGGSGRLTNAVPEPATTWLIATGLVAFGVLGELAWMVPRRRVSKPRPLDRLAPCQRSTPPVLTSER
jgi:hypothetical protein